MPRPYGTVRPKRDWIIAELAKGRFLLSIAREIGVNSTTISDLFAKDGDYIRARIDGTNARLMEASDLLKDAALNHPDNPTLAESRAMYWRAMSWFAEREFPALYGRNKLPIRLISKIIEQLREAQASGLTRTPIRLDAAPLPRRARKRRAGGNNGGNSEAPPPVPIDESET